jgi:hypothetical protein
VVPSEIVFGKIKRNLFIKRKTKYSNLQIIKVWYLAQIRNWSLQVAVPKAPGKVNQNTNIQSLHGHVNMHTSWLPSHKDKKLLGNMKGL